MFLLNRRNKHPRIDSQFITYDEDFNILPQTATTFKYFVYSKKEVKTTIGNLYLPKFAKLVINGEDASSIYIDRSTPTIRILAVNGLTPAIKNMRGRNINYIFALPVFNIQPKYLLVDNIVVVYPDEIPNYRAGYNTFKMDRI